jgi:hypothetical protein
MRQYNAPFQTNDAGNVKSVSRSLPDNDRRQECLRTLPVKSFHR